MKHLKPVEEDPQRLSLAEAARAIRAGRLSSETLVAQCLGVIDRFDAQLHAFVEVYRDEALACARALDAMARAGHFLGPLHGLPIAVKDLFEIEGKFITGGSIATPPRLSTVTATAVRRLREAGAIVIGKTHTVEYAFGGWGTNAAMGTPWNPWDLRTHRVPGGSSSGSAVALAAGMCFGAIGTDTGGSVRIPAGLCGLVGLKTTHGLISRHGLLALCPSHDTVGPITRTVEDAALMLDAMAGPDALDAACLGAPAAGATAQLGRGVQGLRAGVLPKQERAGVQADVLQAYDRALDSLAALGVTLVPAVLPEALESYMATAGALMSAEGYANLGALFEQDGLPFDPHVRQRILKGRGTTAGAYLALQRHRHAAQQAMAQAMDFVDVCVFPTNPITAIPVAEVDELATPLSRFGRFVNLLNLCAVAVPVGLSPAQGLPISMQVIGKPGAEALALRLGHAYQGSTGWHRLRPAGLRAANWPTAPSPQPAPTSGSGSKEAPSPPFSGERVGGEGAGQAESGR
jgi:aspartyl-tRNA(Asn)/glutamyl-tRNA(Gln) amidotransferase subunit A